MIVLLLIASYVPRSLATCLSRRRELRKRETKVNLSSVLVVVNGMRVLCDLIATRSAVLFTSLWA